MRSTITLYSAASPIFVPPSFTNSAVTPSFFPSPFTRSINAGGKLNSRPHINPTFAISPPNSSSSPHGTVKHHCHPSPRAARSGNVYIPQPRNRTKLSSRTPRLLRGEGPAFLFPRNLHWDRQSPDWRLFTVPSALNAFLFPN